MALTISMEGLGVIAYADSLTSDTGGGSWGEDGGGTNYINNDVYLYGSASIGMKYASKSGWTYYDYGSGLDFTASTGTYAGQFIWFWVNIQSAGQFDSLANKGFAIRIGSSTSDYREYIIAGNDDANGWTGGWKLFVIDPTKAGSVTDTGTFDISSVRYFGLWIDTIVSVRAESIFMSQIWVGEGLRITGTSTQGWKDVADWCTAYASRAHGGIQIVEGIYFAHGAFYIGDSTQTSATSFADSDAHIIQFGTSEYYYSSAWVETYPSTAQKIVVEDAASYATTFEDGVIVGTDNGRSGTTIIGTSGMEVSVDLYGGNNSGSLTKLYGTQFKDLLGGITWGNDADHLFYGGAVIGCGQFDPVGAPKLRNLLFVGTQDSHGGSNVDGAALLWNSNIDIQDCKFIANTDTTGDPAGIQHDAAGAFDYTRLDFSGNDYDILHNATATAEGGSYSETNQDTTVNINGTNNIIAQTFIVGISAADLSRARFYISKTGTLTGNVYATLYATSGAGTAPTGSALATSEVVAASSIGASLGWVDFEFEDEYTMSAVTWYAIAIDYSGADADVSNYISVGVDNSSPSHSGTGYAYTTSWSSQTWDVCHYVHSGGIVAISNIDGSVSDSGRFVASYAGALIVSASVNITITVLDSDLDPIQDAQVAVYRSSDNVELMNEDTLSTCIAQQGFNYPGSDVDIYIRVRKSSTGSTRYIPFSTTGKIESGGFSLTVTLRQDTIVAA
jgi:hypothetical protein